MEVPKVLIDEVRTGRVVLFLGAGASIGASLPSGNSLPLGQELMERLCERFHGGKHKDESLSWVAEIAISVTDLLTVQDFVAEQVRGAIPADFHMLIPTFKWRGIVTTNYDLIIEAAYGAVDKRIQEAVPILSNQDRVDDKLRSDSSVGLIKLHGCITRTHDPDLPLILTADHFATHSRNRDRLYRLVLEWGTENTIVFVGHKLQDPDLRQILIRLTEEIGESRPRYYLVQPGVTDDVKQLWAEKRITVLDGTLEEFMNVLDGEIPEKLRPLLGKFDTDHPVKLKYAVDEEISSAIRDLVTYEAQYVHASMKYEVGTPQKFYKGFDLGWYPVVEKLDVRRSLTNTLLDEIIIRTEGDRPTDADFYLIKGEAGSGKSVLLRRLAWEAATDANCICLYCEEHGAPTVDALRELNRVTKSRIFLFIDQAVRNKTYLVNLLTELRRGHLAVTVITTERVNEWNVGGEELSVFVSDEWRVRYLSHVEIQNLVKLLEQHDSLGTRLRQMAFDERVTTFEKQAGRQLLVALHEATLGKPFEEILVDEYRNITPAQAQQLYLSVCMLNRLGVPVRAGLIARVHGIPFSQFKSKFFGPLEHVVKVDTGRRGQDYHYVARHPHIAEIVFDRMLASPADKYNEYARIFAHLNVAYSADREAFRQLVRAKSLHEHFPRYEDVKALFDLVEKVAGRDAYLLQQRANYERIRPNGDLARARELAYEAHGLSPRDQSISHTLAEIARSRARQSQGKLERQKYRREAKSILQYLVKDAASRRHALVTIANLDVEELLDLAGDDNATDSVINSQIRELDRLLLRAKQEYPGDVYILEVEAKFGEAINDNERSLRALELALQANDRDPYIAGRLSAVYQSQGKVEQARKVLENAIESNAADKSLKYRYAMVMREVAPEDADTLRYHFRGAFSKWDQNHEAMFWYARYAYESSDASDREEAREVFRHLRSVPMSQAARIEVRDVISQAGEDRQFDGTVVNKDASHGFVRVDGTGNDIFFHSSAMPEDHWGKVEVGTRLRFNVGFSFTGVKAIQLVIVSAG